MLAFCACKPQETIMPLKSIFGGWDSIEDAAFQKDVSFR